MSFLSSGGQFLQAAGLGDSKLSQGIVGFEAEKGKAQRQVGVLIALFVALVLGIIAVILLSTGVSGLESYADYFKVTSHQVGLGFGGATLLTLLVATVMLHSITECAEDTLAAAQQFPTQPQIGMQPYMQQQFSF